ncbi:MAG: ATP-binding protein [Hungatella sp.]|jgi:predicted AAA+ superfamily ATPase|nr:ATP-binding protein [Hungatella sp.]
MVIERKEYFQQLLGYKDKKIIKVITGIRRCGKSTLLKIFQDYLLDSGVEREQIVSINFEDFEYEDLWEPKALYAYIKDRIISGKMMYLILDEIQNVREFQRVVDSFFIKDNIDIYITGSNSYMLSGELATLLSGRYVKIQMLPFSFAEFVKAFHMEDQLERAYQRYIETSSFPYTIQLDRGTGQINDYLRGIYDTIILKDIISRKKITDVMMLESVIRFLADNIGNPLSTKKISDTMISNGRKINVRTVESYIIGFMESYIVYQAKRYDIKGKQYLKTLEKYYMADIGLRNVMLNSRGGQDVGHILENVIYLELIRRGYEVYIGKVDQAEVDFVVKNMDGIKYIQAAATVRDEETLERELRPLKKINDHYPKCVMTLDMDPPGDYNGIRRFNALDYLVGRINF